MARTGDIIENPITGERITFLKTSQDTEGEMLQIEWVIPPRFSIPEHVHPRQEERHEVLSGTLRGRVGGKERDYGEGQRVVGPPSVPHAWRNPSDEEEVRLLSELLPASNFEALFETGFRVMRDWKRNKMGAPMYLLQIAVLARELKDDFYFTGLPVIIQKTFLALFAPLAYVGRRLGYEARHPEYGDPK